MSCDNRVCLLKFLDDFLCAKVLDLAINGGAYADASTYLNIMLVSRQIKRIASPLFAFVGDMLAEPQTPMTYHTNRSTLDSLLPPCCWRGCHTPLGSVLTRIGCRHHVWDMSRLVRFLRFPLFLNALDVRHSILSGTYQTERACYFIDSQYVLSPRTFSLSMGYDAFFVFEAFARNSLLFNYPREVLPLLEARCTQASAVCPVGTAYFFTDADIAALIVNSEWEHLLLYLKAVYECVLEPNMLAGGVVVAPDDCALFRFFTLYRSCEPGNSFNLPNLLPFNLRPFRLGLRVSCDGQLATVLIGASLRWLRKAHKDVPLAQLVSMMFDGTRDLDHYSTAVLRQSAANHLHKWHDLKKLMQGTATAHTSNSTKRAKADM